MAITVTEQPHRINAVRLMVNTRLLCRTALALGTLLFIFLFLRLTFSLYDRFAYMAFDIGLFNQAVWLIAHGKPPFVTLSGVHILGDHFSPFLYLLAPMYAIVPSPKTLLLLQTIGVGLGAIPTYALATRRLRSEPLGLMFGLIYLLYPAHQWSITYEFHPDTFATPLLLTAFYAIESKRWRLYAITLLLTSLIKEMAGLTIACVGVWAFMKDRRAGVGTILFGIMMLPISLLTIEHFNNGQSTSYFALFNHFGNTPGVIAQNFMHHPVVFLTHLFSPSNLGYACQLIIPLCALPLIAPEILLMALPMLCVNFMSSRPGMHSVEEYYNAFITPILFLGAIKGFERMQNFGWFFRWAIRINLPLMACYGIMLGPLVRPLDTIYSAQPPPEAIAECRVAVSQVPLEASVSAMMAPGSHLSSRAACSLYPNPFIPCCLGNTIKARYEIESVTGTMLPSDLQAACADPAALAKAEYVVLCPHSNTFPLSDINSGKLTVALLQSHRYEVTYIGQNVLVLRLLEIRNRSTLRELSQRSGKPVGAPIEIEAAYWRWYAAQYSATKEKVL